MREFKKELFPGEASEGGGEGCQTAEEPAQVSPAEVAVACPRGDSGGKLTPWVPWVHREVTGFGLSQGDVNFQLWTGWVPAA